MCYWDSVIKFLFIIKIVYTDLENDKWNFNCNR